MTQGGPGSLEDGIARLAELVMSEETVQSVLDLVVDVTRTTIPNADAVSIMVKRGHRASTVARTDDFLDDLDAVQHKHGGGPCVQAVTEGVTVRVADLTQDERWPAFARAAAESGFVSTLSVPLTPVMDTVGVLNIYSSSRAGFDGASEKMANLLSHQAAIAIANSNSQVDTEEANVQLRDALASRDVIGQAKGILMERGRISEEEAFNKMRTESQRSNRKLRDIAEDIVRGVGGHDA